MRYAEAVIIALPVALFTILGCTFCGFSILSSVVVATIVFCWIVRIESKDRKHDG